MRSPLDIWRERLLVWVPALLFFALNLVFFSTYRLVLAGQEQLRAGRIQRLEAKAAALASDRAAIEDLVARAERNRARLEEFYNGWLTTEEQRLTRVISEVKGLARRAGVEPAVLSYPEEEIDEHGLIKRSIAFAVDGSYVEVRRLINFLELSDLFLTLEEVRLSGGAEESADLRINLKISTLFVQEGESGAQRGSTERIGS